ncbi:MAG: SDR family NAD(P)-dependent oxidoreductase [Mycobacteriales bacterium]
MSADTTTSDVLQGVELAGRTAVVTGVSAGLGVETARALRSVGARVIGAARDLDKARTALAGVDGVELVALDLADLDSVRTAATEVLARVDRIDLLINNAGVMAPPLSRTAQGFELQLGTNHLGHFVWTNALTPRLGPGSRIVNVSSRGHLRSPMRWDDPHFRDEATYEKWTAYGQSKTANVLFTVELEKRLSAQGIHAYALHPGVIMTELSRHLSADDLTALASRVPAGALTLKDVSAGAATTLWAATSPELEGRGGLYLEDCHVADVTPGDGSAGYAPYAMDSDEAARLWEWSLEQTAP